MADSKSTLAGITGKTLGIGLGIPLISAVVLSVVGVIVSKKYYPDAKYLFGIGGFVVGSHIGAAIAAHSLRSYGTQLNKDLNTGTTTKSASTTTKVADTTSGGTKTKTTSTGSTTKSSSADTASKPAADNS